MSHRPPFHGRNLINRSHEQDNPAKERVESWLTTIRAHSQQGDQTELAAEMTRHHIANPFGFGVDQEDHAYPGSGQVLQNATSQRRGSDRDPRRRPVVLSHDPFGVDRLPVSQEDYAYPGSGPVFQNATSQRRGSDRDPRRRPVVPPHDPFGVDRLPVSQEDYAYPDSGPVFQDATSQRRGSDRDPRRRPAVPPSDPFGVDRLPVSQEDYAYPGSGPVLQNSTYQRPRSDHDPWRRHPVPPLDPVIIRATPSDFDRGHLPRGPEYPGYAYQGLGPVLPDAGSESSTSDDVPFVPGDPEYSATGIGSLPAVGRM